MGGFKKITIIKRENNLGLAENIINGVMETITNYGKVIVLEDDIVTSPYFLSFMNDALEFYKDKKKVWHISGWSYPIDMHISEDVFLWHRMDCWGWATWLDRWDNFEKNSKKLIREFKQDDIDYFNLDATHTSWNQVIANNKGQIDTWAIFWYATIFKNGGLCLNPKISYVDNIGFDNSGTHCGVKTDNLHKILNHKSKINFSSCLEENSLALNAVKKYYIER